MKNLGVFCLGILVVMAVLVNMGWIRDDGVFGVTDTVYSSVTPIVKKVTDAFLEVYAEDLMYFEDDETVMIVRIRFKDNRESYYCDLICRAEKRLEGIGSVGGVSTTLSNGSFFICDTNYPRELTLRDNPLYLRIIDESKFVLDRTLYVYSKLVETGSHEVKGMVYSTYLEKYKGNDISLYGEN